MATVPIEPIEEQPFRAQVTARADSVEVRMQGALDLATVSDVRQLGMALQGTTGPVTIDLADLVFVDSTGITTLVGLKGELDLQLRSVEFVRVRPQVLDVLRMLGVDEALGIST